jgi:hypothetical protein
MTIETLKGPWTAGGAPATSKFTWEEIAQLMSVSTYLHSPTSSTPMTPEHLTRITRVMPMSGLVGGRRSHASIGACPAK